MKRSRLNRSGSFGNIRVINPPPAAASASRWNTVANPSVISAHAPPPKVWEKARAGILTLSAPEVAVGNDQDSYFLDRCFLCKKVLSHNDERFMYGDFRAFCSPECRTTQFIVENPKDKISKQSTGTKRECSKKNGLKYLSGAQLEKHAS